MTLSDHHQSALNRRLAVEQRDRRLPSIVAAATHQDQVVWSSAVGSLDARGGPSPDADTQFRIGSITKTLIAVEIMRLRDEGKVELAAPVSTYVGEVSIGHLSIAQLLTHSSGIQAETDSDWWERAPGGSWDDLVAESPTTRLTPGTAFHYSNVGFGVLGEVIAQLRGTTWHDAVARGILEPLDMFRTTPRPDGAHAPGWAVHPWADLVHAEPEYDAGAMAPAGQYWATVTDLARWASFLAGETAGVLSNETLSEMMRPIAVVDLPGQSWTGAHGLGLQIWNVDGQRYVGHGGSMPGFLAGVRVNIETGNGISLLTNSTGGLGPTVMADLGDLLDKASPQPVEPWTADGDQASALDLTGPWFWGPYRFDLAIEPDGVLRFGEPGLGRGSRFGRDGDAWVGRDGYYTGEPLRVDRDSDGRPTRLWLASFVFTRQPYEADSDTPGGLDPAGWH